MLGIPAISTNWPSFLGTQIRLGYSTKSAALAYQDPRTNPSKFITSYIPDPLTKWMLWIDSSDSPKALPSLTRHGGYDLASSATLHRRKTTKYIPQLSDLSRDTLVVLCWHRLLYTFNFLDIYESCKFCAYHDALLRLSV